MDLRKLSVTLWGSLLILIPLVGVFVLLGGLPILMLGVVVFLFVVATAVLK